MNWPLTQEEIFQYLSVFVLECTIFVIFFTSISISRHFYVDKFPDFKKLASFFFHFLLNEKT